MAETDARDTEISLGVLLFIPYRAMENRVVEAITNAGFDDLSEAQRKLFARIGHNGTRLTELAEQAQVTKQAAGLLVDQLEAAGYVERVLDPADGRARLVCIAERGRRLVAIASATATEVETEWATHLGQRRSTQLRQALVKLREITDPYA